MRANQYLMSFEDLVEQINEMCQLGEPQTPAVLMELKSIYFDMFLNHCGAVPDFDIINNKGQIELTKNLVPLKKEKK